MSPHPIAIISEPECIGCTKCIQVCPVDAIIGSAKKMHTVISDYCTGCEACIQACPVNCIDLQSIESQNINWVARAQAAELNTQKRNQRLEVMALQKKQERELAVKNKNIQLEIQACIQRKKSSLMARHE